MAYNINQSYDESSSKFVADYIKLNPLPANKYLNIEKIISFNRKKTRSGRGDPGNYITYEMFHSADGGVYQKCGCRHDCGRFDGNISPVVIIDSSGNQFKVNHYFWDFLSLFCIDLETHLPHRIYIDETNILDGEIVCKWMITLYKLTIS